MLEMVVKGFELEREVEAAGRSTVSSGAIHGCVWELGAWWLRWWCDVCRTGVMDGAGVEGRDVLSDVSLVTWTSVVTMP